MRLSSVSARKSERLLGNWQEGFVFAWSPDSSQVAAMTGPLNGARTLGVINVENGRRTRIARRGYFSGVSFSPESDEIVYGVAPTPAYPPNTDIYRDAIETGR